MKLVIELIKCRGDFGMEFLINTCCGKSVFLKRYSTKLFCMVGQLVYACIVCIMCTWYLSNAQKNIIMLFLNLSYHGHKAFCMVSLGKLILTMDNHILTFKCGIDSLAFNFSDSYVEPLRISLENIPQSNATKNPYLQFILDPKCHYRIE